MQLGLLPTDDRASPASYIDYTTLLSFENIHDLTSSNLSIIYELRKGLKVMPVKCYQGGTHKYVQLVSF